MTAVNLAWPHIARHYPPYRTAHYETNFIARRLLVPSDLSSVYTNRQSLTRPTRIRTDASDSVHVYWMNGLRLDSDKVDNGLSGVIVLHGGYKQAQKLCYSLPVKTDRHVFAVNGSLFTAGSYATTALHAKYTVWVKKFPRGYYIFFIFFSNGCEFLIDFLTHLLYVPIFARLQIFIQLYPTLTKLCHIKRDYLARVICSKCPPSAETHGFGRLRKSLIVSLIVVCGKSLWNKHFYNVNKHVIYHMTSTVTSFAQ